MTKLTYSVTRRVDIRGVRQPVVVSLVPCHGARDTLLLLRAPRHRVPYVITLADCYRMAALWHGNKEKLARTAARKQGIPWKQARKQFLASLIPPMPKRPRKPKASHAA